MKRFIGGMLIAAMLYQPGYLVYGAVAFQLDKQKPTEIITFIDKEYYPAIINDYIFNIVNAPLEIRELIESKNRLLSAVDKKMSDNARINKRMAAEQIKLFKEFSSYSEKASVDIRSMLYEIEDLSWLPNAQKEILKPDTNYGIVINELALLHNKQLEVIKKLKEVLNKGESALLYL